MTSHWLALLRCEHQAPGEVGEVLGTGWSEQEKVQSKPSLTSQSLCYCGKGSTYSSGWIQTCVPYCLFRRELSEFDQPLALASLHPV